MTDHKPSRREILRPLHLVGIALGCGIFATVVTLVSTGAFTARVNLAIARGTYEGLTPLGLGLVVGGAAFIITLLLLAMLLLAIDPADVTKRVDRPVLYDATDADDAGDAGAGAEAGDADDRDAAGRAGRATDRATDRRADRATDSTDGNPGPADGDGPGSADRRDRS
ncbi:MULTISPECIES: amino acid transporter [Microbacterium]|uniref:amino acid transporter n=1 Tax=Microbacterium TaxID=33882 RepID=UPI00217DE9D5|nr:MULTISPECIES: amino acid transporter [Microbacterium]